MDGLLVFKNQLRGGRVSFSALARARAQLSPGLYAEALSWLRDTPFFGKRLTPPPFHKSLRTIARNPSLSPLPLDRELRWAIAYLMSVKNVLTPILRLRAEFVRAILRGDTIGATSCLHDLRARGLSLWYLKWSILLSQLRDGLPAQKQVTREYMTELGNNTLQSFIVYFYSILCEPHTPFSHFKTSLDTTLAGQDVSVIQSAYVQLHDTGRLPQDPGLQAALLAYEYWSSPLDLFDLTLRVARASSVAATNTDTTAYGWLAGFLADAQEHDPTLVTPGDAPALEDNAVLCLFGEPGLRADAFANALSLAPYSPSVLFLASTASVPRDLVKPGVHRDPFAIHDTLHVFGAGGVGAPAAEEAARATSVHFAFNSLGQSLTALLDDNATPGATAPTRPERHLLSTLSPQSIPLQARFGTRATTSQALTHLPSLGAYGEAVRATLAGNLSTLAQLGAEGTLEACTLGLHALSVGDADRHLRPLVEGASPYYGRRALRLLVDVHLRHGDSRALASLVATQCVRDADLASALPLPLVAAHSATHRTAQQDNIALPVLFDLVSKAGVRGYTKHRLFALRGFLRHHGLVLPSQLTRVAPQLPSPLLAHLLEHVCTENTLSLLGALTSSHAVVEERAAVLRLLRVLDPHATARAEEELKTLAKRTMLRKRQAQIDASKVSVDIDGLVAHVQQYFAREFARFRELLRTTPSAAELLVTQIKDIVGKIGENGPKTIVLRVPKDEAAESLRTLTAYVRNEYALSGEHGLDKYLSVRIRHGTLAAALRRPLEDLFLVTTRVGGDGYQRNPHWDHVFDVRSGAANELQRYLADFSRDCDALAETIKGWFHIRTGGDGDGKLDFSIGDDFIRDVRSRLPDDADEGAALRAVIAALDDRLDRELVGMRTTVLGEAKARYLTLFDTLADRIHRLLASHTAPDLLTAIAQGRTSIPTVLARVASWCQRRHVSTTDPYSLDEALAVAEEAVRGMHAQFRVNVSKMGGQEVMLRGQSFTHVIDALHLLFENAARHAEVSPAPATEVSTQWDERRLTIVVQNPVGDHVPRDAREAAIAAVRAKLTQDPDVAGVRSEGGSGLVKLNAILSHDLGVTDRWEFGLVNGEYFRVSVTLPLERLTDAHPGH